MTLAKDKIFPFGFVGDGFDVAMDCNGEFFVNGQTCSDPSAIVEALKMAGKLFFEEEKETTDLLDDMETSGFYGIFIKKDEKNDYRKTVRKTQFIGVLLVS